MSADQQEEKGSESDDQSRHTSDPHRARVEWATLLVSAMLLLTVAAILIHAQLTGGDGAPLIEAQVELSDVRRDGDAYHVPIRVRNRGHAGARDVQIRVAPTRPTSAADESVDLTLDVLPPGASETAIAVLQDDPARTPVEARVVSYLSD